MAISTMLSATKNVDGEDQRAHGGAVPRERDMLQPAFERSGLCLLIDHAPADGFLTMTSFAAPSNASR
ncbi:MAG TPA: hypothetical protein VK281_11935 [Xanthobacteraceae bacterium]|nr:hypothetical protein [Xanthobacteraceae bacterium]